MAAVREDAGVAVQLALYDALCDIGITLFTVRPQEADGGFSGPYPHIHIDEPIIGAWDTNSELGHEITQRIHVRDRGRTNLRVKRLQGAIYERLHRADLILEDWTLILIHQEQSFVTPLPDGTFDGISEFRLLIEQS